MKKVILGFTLIELIVVIGIIGTLATIVVVRFSGPREEAQNSQRRSDLKQYQTAIEVYANRNNGLFPDSGGITVNLTSLCVPLALGTCPDDPVVGNYKYSANAGRSAYVLWAQLAKTDTFFALCSTGAVGEMPSTWTGPSGAGVCPL